MADTWDSTYGICKTVIRRFKSGRRLLVSVYVGAGETVLNVELTVELIWSDPNQKLAWMLAMRNYLLLFSIIGYGVKFVIKLTLCFVNPSINYQ